MDSYSAMAPADMPMGGPPLAIGPQRTGKPDKKPNEKDVLADVEDLLQEHEPRLLDAEAMHRTLQAHRDDLDVGHFETDEELIESGEVEVFRLNTLRDELEFNNGVISQMDPYIEHLSHERIDADEVLTIEDACYYALAQFSRQYSKARSSKWRRQLINYLQRTGAIVSLLTPDPDEPYCGVRYSLIDPLTCFPVWGGADGLDAMVRVYRDTAGNIIGNYRDPSGELERKVLKQVKSGTSSTTMAAKRTFVEAKEYWNKDHFVLLVNDKLVLSREHGLNRVPFIVTLGGFELPLGMSSGRHTIWDHTTSEPGLHSSGESDDQDIAAHWRPWLSRHLQGHAIQEAVGGRVLTQFRKSGRPPTLYEFDVMTKNQDRLDLSYDDEALNKIPLGNRLSILPTSPDAPTVATLGVFLTQNAQQGLWSQIRSGAIPPQTPSAALGTMFDLGGADRSALTDGVAMHLRDLLEWFLEIWRDWGEVLGPRKQRGAIAIPSADTTYRTPAHHLTPAIIRRAGCGLNVSLFAWRPDPALAQYLATMMSSGLSSPETAIRKSRYVPDPLRELTRIEDALLRQTPEIATQLKLKQLNQEIDQALAEGDYDSADYAAVAAGQLEWNAEQQMMAGAAPPAGQSGPTGAGAMGNALGAGVPNPNGMAGPGSVGAPLNQQGLSMPEVGIGTGQQGGRPLNTTQTTQATQPNRVTAPPR